MKSVSFADVSVYNFPIILGDNPAVRSGAPIQLDWIPVEMATVDFELYNYMRQWQRRSRKELSLSDEDRMEILQLAGITVEEIEGAVSQVHEIRQQRASTVKEGAKENGLNDRVLQAILSTGMLPVNAIRGVIKLGSRSKQNSTSARSA